MNDSFPPVSGRVAEQPREPVTSSDQTTRLLTLTEASRTVPCSVSTLRRRIREGTLPAVRIGPSDNSPIRIHPRDLNAWLFDEGDDAA